MACIVLFNKRRGGEVSKMLLNHCNSQPDWNSGNSQELKNFLTAIEKQLANNLKLIEINGKRGRKVPVLLTQEVIMATEKLSLTRTEVEIPPENEYVFARPFGGSLGYLRASDCLRTVVSQVNLKAPEWIKSTRLRKYIATVTQVIDLRDNEVDWLARHLGHDIRIHRDFYRLHESAVELTKVSRLLLAVDEGKIDQFAGKSLGDINLNDFPNLSHAGGNEPELEDSSDEESKNDELEEPSPVTVLLNPPNPVTKKSFIRKKWQPNVIKAVTTFFHHHIRKQIIPGKERIMQCKKKYDVLNTRTWKDIKYYVKNFITKLNNGKKIK